MSNGISTSKGLFLFASTIVGAGILALPVIASGAGFLPLAAMIVVLAGVASLSGLYIAECVLADSADSHLPALADRHLGTWGLIAMLLGIAIYVYGARHRTHQPGQYISDVCDAGLAGNPDRNGGPKNPGPVSPSDELVFDL